MQNTLKIKLESHSEYMLFPCQNIFNAEMSYSDFQIFQPRLLSMEQVDRLNRAPLYVLRNGF